MASHVEQAVAARIAAAKRRTEDMRRQRAELAAARKRGLALRHAAKLRHLRGAEDHADPSRGDTATTEGQSPKVAPVRGDTPTDEDEKGTAICRTPGGHRTSSGNRGDTDTAEGDTLSLSPSAAPVSTTDATVSVGLTETDQ